jgi:hypothetical protein
MCSFQYFKRDTTPKYTFWKVKNERIPNPLIFSQHKIIKSEKKCRKDAKDPKDGKDTKDTTKAKIRLIWFFWAFSFLLL